MVIITLGRYYDIDPYFKELTSADLIRNRDYVYRILPNNTDPDRPCIRVGIEFLDDRYTSYYQLKWA